MRTFLFLFFLCFYTSVISQNPDEKINEFVDFVCEETMKLRNGDEMISLQDFYEDKVSVKSLTEEEAEVAYLRLQSNCEAFSIFVTSSFPLSENLSDWVILTEKPAADISKREIKDFYKSKGEYFYYTTQGDLITVEISKKKWTERMSDGTYSKCTLKKNGNKFVLTFIESNNFEKNAFSYVGQEYNYELLDFKDDYFVILFSFGDQGEVFYKTKLYTKHPHSTS